MAGAAGLALAIRPRLALCPPQGSTARVPAHLAFACDAETCWEVEGQHNDATSGETDENGTAPREVGGRFTSGEIDLTGDGVPENVRLDDASLVVLWDDEPVWRSEPGWTVVDAALGDPNQDGRYEVLLAFWRDDAAGTPRSQPFIVGYRGGLWRTLWGGSPVTDPILELALGDVDGDGAEDLVVIEAANGYDDLETLLGAERDTPNVPSTFAVWHWHGWGYSRIWRSDVGSYHDLVIVPGQSDAPSTIHVVRRADGH